MSAVDANTITSLPDELNQGPSFKKKKKTTGEFEQLPHFHMFCRYQTMEAANNQIQ